MSKFERLILDIPTLSVHYSEGKYRLKKLIKGSPKADGTWHVLWMDELEINNLVQAVGKMKLEGEVRAED